MKTKAKHPKTSDEANSSQIVVSINDILIEILLRLPIKSLIRFKLVSKNWHALITNPTFCRLRSLNPNSAIGLFLPSPDFWVNHSFQYFPFCHQESTNPPFRTLNFIEDPSGIKIMQSCNGLFLCSSLLTRELDTSYYVCNPTTKNFSTLPKLEDGSGSYKGIVGMSLAFDPAKSSHYRVICTRGFVMDSDEYYYQIEMYSFEIGSWRVCGEPFTEGVNFEKPAYWNGAIHWINYGRGDSLYFSIDDQVIETMPMPPFPDGWDWRGDYYFGESSGHLHYINISSQNIQLDVYELKRDYSEWFVKYQIDLSPVLTSHPRAIRDPENWDISIFCLVCGKEQEDSFLIFPIPGKFIRYYLGHNSFETFYEFVDDEVEYSWFWRKTGIQYIESLSFV